jgi:undecaprenyl-diphosphatase
VTDQRVEPDAERPGERAPIGDEPGSGIPGSLDDRLPAERDMTPGGLDEGVAGLPGGRWSGRRIVRRLAGWAVLGFLVVELLLHADRSTSTLELVARARPGWVGVVAAAAAATYATAALGTIGSTTVRLRGATTVVMQLASSFVNRLVPGGVAGVVLNVRYLERAGARRAEAVAANALNTAAGLAVHVAIFLALVPFFGGLPSDIDPPDDYGALVALFVALTGIGVVVWVRWIPHGWKGQLRLMGQAASAVVRSARRLVLLVGGSGLLTVCHGLALWASVRSVGGGLAFVDVAIVYLVAAALGAVSPTPGGLGAIEVALISGLTRTGVPAAQAAAAGLINRFVTFWLPVAPGFVAYRWLRRHDTV